MDFILRGSDSLVPEVKAQDGATASFHALISKDAYADIRYGIKLGNKNIDFSGIFYTFPYVLAFFLKHFLQDHS